MKKFLILLAVFCIIGSVAAVSAEDLGGYAGSNYQDMNGVSGSQYYVNEALEPGNGLPLENQTGYVPTDANGQPLANATSQNVTNATNHTSTSVSANVTGNSTNASATHTLPATGNPIIGLLAVTSLIGGYAVLKRRN